MSTSPKNYFDLLDVSESANFTDIQQAYIKTMNDSNYNLTMQEFLEYNKAQEWVSDVFKKYFHYMQIMQKDPVEGKSLFKDVFKVKYDTYKERVNLKPIKVFLSIFNSERLDKSKISDSFFGLFNFFKVANNVLKYETNAQNPYDYETDQMNFYHLFDLKTKNSHTFPKGKNVSYLVYVLDADDQAQFNTQISEGLLSFVLEQKNLILTMINLGSFEHTLIDMNLSMDELYLLEKFTDEFTIMDNMNELQADETFILQTLHDTILFPIKQMMMNWFNVQRTKVFVEDYLVGKPEIWNLSEKEKNLVGMSLVESVVKEIDYDDVKLLEQHLNTVRFLEYIILQSQNVIKQSQSTNFRQETQKSAENLIELSGGKETLEIKESIPTPEPIELSPKEEPKSPNYPQLDEQMNENIIYVAFNDRSDADWIKIVEFLNKRSIEEYGITFKKLPDTYGAQDVLIYVHTTNTSEMDEIDFDKLDEERIENLSEKFKRILYVGIIWNSPDESQFSYNFDNEEYGGAFAMNGNYEIYNSEKSTMTFNKLMQKIVGTKKIMAITLNPTQPPTRVEQTEKEEEEEEAKMQEKIKELDIQIEETPTEQEMIEMIESPKPQKIPKTIYITSDKSYVVGKNLFDDLSKEFEKYGYETKYFQDTMTKLGPDDIVLYLVSYNKNTNLPFTKLDNKQFENFMDKYKDQFYLIKLYFNDKDIPQYRKTTFFDKNIPMLPMIHTMQGILQESTINANTIDTIVKRIRPEFETEEEETTETIAFVPSTTKQEKEQKEQQEEIKQEKTSPQKETRVVEKPLFEKKEQLETLKPITPPPPPEPEPVLEPAVQQMSMTQTQEETKIEPKQETETPSRRKKYKVSFMQALRLKQRGYTDEQIEQMEYGLVSIPSDIELQERKYAIPQERVKNRQEETITTDDPSEDELALFFR